MKEIRYCARCHETYEVEEQHTTCIKLPKGCKSKTGDCFKDDTSWILKYGGWFGIFIVICLLCLIYLTSCNFSVNLIHSGKEGSIDEIDEARPDVKPNLNLSGVPL
jgi:hypothetical protein